MDRATHGNGQRQPVPSPRLGEGSWVLFRIAWDHAWHRPLQSLFLIVGVAIGVAMVVAIDLANSSASRAFRLSTEAVAGRTTHHILGGPGGLDEQVYVKLRTELGHRLCAPVVEGYLKALDLDGQPMRLLGIDPLVEAPFRGYLQQTGSSGWIDPDLLRALMTQPRTVLMGADVANRYGVGVGEDLSVQSGANRQVLRIVGLLEPANEMTRRALEGLLLCDIAAAQEVLGRIGALDRIDLILPEGEDERSAILARIEAALPAGTSIESSQARAGTVDQMTAAFRINLTALSLLALVVGVFLVYNTVMFSVVQRWPVLGTLRALGVTRAQIFALVLIESGILGLIGTAAGLALGVLLGRGTVQLVTQTVNDLFFLVTVRETTVSSFTLLKGLIGGLGAAVIAALVPAREATRVPPAGVLQRSQMEERVRHTLRWVTVAGVALLISGVLLLVPEWHLALTFAGVFGVIMGMAFLSPLLTYLLIQVLWLPVGAIFGVLGRMASRDIVRSLSRTSVAVASLMVAVSVIIGVSVMIGSFRQTVDRWLSDTLRADIFISPPTLVANRITATLEPGLAERLRRSPGVAEVFTSREVDVRAPKAGWLHLIIISGDITEGRRQFKDAIGDFNATWRAFTEGGVMINETMGRKLDLGVGDSLALLTDQGERRFPIVAVTYDFDVQFNVLMYRDIYLAFWGDQAVSAIALDVERGIDVDTKVAELRRTLSDRTLVIRSNRGMRSNALTVFDRTFSVTVALQLLATVVAFIGVLSALMSLQLERTREIGVLRAAGLTRGQLWKLTLLETGLMGSCAGLTAIPTGLLLAAILTYIINLRSFGWSLQMQIEPIYLIQAFGVALISALLAAIYPSWWMGRIQPADALREE